MRLYKNAQMEKYLVMIVIMLVVIVVLIFLPKKIGEAAEGAASRAACEKSLETISNLQIFAGSLSDSLGDFKKISCTTEFIETSSAKEKLTEEFALNIYDCWDLYSPRKSLFDQNKGSYCIICKVITATDSSGITRGLIDYMKSGSPPGLKGTYISNAGGDELIASNAFDKYNLYSFAKNEQTAVVVTFGRISPAASHLLYDAYSGIGLLLHPYSTVSALGCYSFEGRTNELTFKR